MSVTRFRLTRATRVERHVIEILRSANANPPMAGRFPCPETAFGDLARLAHLAARNGYEIWPADAVYAAPDELKLLGWLALLQRERSDMPISVDLALLAALRDAAIALKPSYYLPHQAILRAGFTLGEKVAVHGSTGGARAVAFTGEARRNTIRARAVAYMREHGPVSAKDLAAIGVSRQYLAILHLKGAVVRVRHGYYEAPACALKSAEAAFRGGRADPPITDYPPDWAFSPAVGLA